MRNKSITKRIILMMIFSLLFFIIGLSAAVIRSAEREYLSVALNNSGSGSMRTMLIANYAQQLADLDKLNDVDGLNKTRKIFESELELYQQYYHALINGNSELGMKKIANQEVIAELELLGPKISLYISSAENIIINADDQESIDFIIANAMPIKDLFQSITVLFQVNNDYLIVQQKRNALIMIVYGTLITVIGLFMTRKLKLQEFHAYNDFLTKLKNRHSLFEFIKNKSPLDYTIYFIDLNKFKIINDTYGHETGDIILECVASRLMSVFGSDTLYRYGGDEFIALREGNLINGDEFDCDNSIDKDVKLVRQALSDPIVDSSGRNHFVGLAMGIISRNVGIEDWHTLINLSDDLMYDSKSITGNVIIYRKKSDVEFRINFIKNFDHVFSKGLIKFSYQPIYTIVDNSIVLYNTLSRWEDNDRVYNAIEFIPLLKRRGHLTELDKYAIKEIDRNYFIEHVSITSERNNSKYALSLAEDTLINAKTNGFLAVAESIKMPKSQVVIKIQEEFLMDDNISETILRLKNSGFILAIDNFTVDFSLRESVKYKNIDIIKIGNSMVSALMAEEYSRNMLKEFIKIFVSIDKMVVVEGIHTGAELDILKSIDSKNNRNILYSDNF
ncbi:EAL domain-containing protein [Bacillaceae bacterium IKA-2]|nr:EAL domain-containing protein [Bacillaceae bacterium IKA-2]